MEWRASTTEIIRSLTEPPCPTTLIIKEVFDKIENVTCLFCDAPIKDSYEHVRSGQCECKETKMSLQYLYAATSEAIGKIGPCIPPKRWTPPCPLWTPQHDYEDNSLITHLRNATRHIIYEEANIGEIHKLKASPPKDPLLLLK
jgi:hypothetical protein